MTRLSASETAEYLFWAGTSHAGIQTDCGLADAIFRVFPAAQLRITHACEDFPAVRSELRLLSERHDHSEQKAAAA